MSAIYLVETPTVPRLVEAASQSQAINFVIKGTHSAKTLKASEVAHYMKNGMQLETVIAEQRPEKPSMETALKQADEALKG